MLRSLSLYKHKCCLLRTHHANRCYRSSVNDQILMKSVSQDSKKAMTHLTFGEMVEHAQFGHHMHDPNYSLSALNSEQFLVQSAEFARKEQPSRVAKLLMCLNNLPYGVSETESIAAVINLYITTYQELKAFDPIKNMQDVHKFCEFSKYVLLKHLLVIPKISYGLLQKATQPNTTFSVETCPYLNNFIDEFAEQRIALRVLRGHMLALYDQIQQKEDIDNVSGLFEENCNIIKYVERAIVDAKAACYSNMDYFKEQCNADNVMPNVEIHDMRKQRDNDIPFTYIPEHLHHMVYELMKNSMRAVMEFNVDKDIDLIVVNNESDGSISIKISDKGGGISRDDLDKIWLYSYTTGYGLNNSTVDEKMTKHRELLGQIIESAEKEWQYEGNDVEALKRSYPYTADNISAVDRSVLGAIKHAPMFGLGYGLPISRKYAQYFGGSCQIQSVDGYGTDAYLYLNNLKRSNVRVI